MYPEYRSKERVPLHARQLMLYPMARALPVDMACIIQLSEDLGALEVTHQRLNPTEVGIICAEHKVSTIRQVRALLTDQIPFTVVVSARFPIPTHSLSYRWVNGNYCIVQRENLAGYVEREELDNLCHWATAFHDIYEKIKPPMARDFHWEQQPQELRRKSLRNLTAPKSGLTALQATQKAAFWYD